MWDIVLDSLIDSLKAAPFLLAIYMLIEFLESNGKARDRTVKLLNGRLSPLIAGGVGLIPQCGFSVMATDLYCQNFLRTGTLVAFFIATSDEALPILLTNSDTVGAVWIVLLVKIVYAVLLGYLINLFDRRKLETVSGRIVVVQDQRESHDHSHSGEHGSHTEVGLDTAHGGECDTQCGSSTVLHISDGCCKHDMQAADKNASSRGARFWNFVKHPLLHTFKIFVYIFVVNAVFGLLLFYFEQSIVGFTANLGVFQGFITAALGLVPNCASSVVICGMYSEGIITFSAMLAGLVSNSGIALAVLFKDRKHWKRNLTIVAVMYVAGAVLGIASYFVEAALK